MDPHAQDSASPSSSSRAAAIATLRRAASNRSSPATSRTPSPTVSRSLSLSVKDRRRSRSIGALSTSFPAAHSNGGDTALFPPPLPDFPSASASSLERTASLLARQLAMARLTGTAPPPVPSTLLGNDEPLPTLAELQHRARAKLAAASSASSTSGTNGAAALARSGTLLHAAAPPLSAMPAPLRRNNTVTGVGTASLEHELVLAALAPASGSAPRAAPAPAVAEAGDERAAARVNLMRKLSARRLAGPTAPRAARPGRPALDVVGVIGRARPRSASVGALDWRAGAEGDELLGLGDAQQGQGAGGGSAQATPRLGDGDGDEDVQDTPRVEHDGRYPGFDGAALEERTPRVPSLSATDDEPSSSTLMPPRAPSTSSTTSISTAHSTSSSLSLSSASASGPSSSLDRSPSAVAVASSGPRRHPAPRPTFGIPAVEYPPDSDLSGDDEWAREARKRGSSASSSLAGAMADRWRGSDAVPLPGVPLLGAGVAARAGAGAGAGAAGSSSARRSVSGAEGARAGAEPDGAAGVVGLGVDGMPPPVPLHGVAPTSASASTSAGGRAESPGQNGAVKGKGFPPPDKDYQFPSPVASPRDSQDLTKASTGKLDGGAPPDPQRLFQQLASKPGRRGRDFALSLSNYQPFTSSTHLSASPLMPDPISPTSVIPDPMSALVFPLQGHPQPQSASASSSRQATPPAPSAQTMTKSASTESGNSLASSGAASSYHSPASMRRTLSAMDGGGSDIFPSAPRVPALPASMHPSSRILAKLDSLLAASEEAPPGHGPSPLDSPPRKLLLHAPVLQVVNANTVKDRHLFLFTDVLVIAKPIIEDHPLTGEPLAPTLDSHFVVKSIVECRDVKLSAVEEPADEASPNSGGGSKKRHPLLVAFVDRFANDPARAIAALVQKGGLSNDGPTIANLLFRNTDLNRNQLGAYLANPKHGSVLRAYVERFRFAGVRIDDAVRLFIMSVRLPHARPAAEHVLEVLAESWTETNGATGFDPALTLALVRQLLVLSDTMHADRDGEHDDGRFFAELPSAAPPSVDDFIAQFRSFDARAVVPEDLLTRVYTSVRRERIEQASDNSIFSMTPDIEATMVPGKLPTRLTYRTPSEVFIISIPEPDPRFTIKLHGTDLQFDPPVLSFARSRTQSFRVTGTALGVRVMLLIKRGANAPRYQGLPLNKAFSVERGFMQHTFQVSFTNHLDVKRKYMFSCAFAGSRNQWLRLLRERISASGNSAQAPASTDDPTLTAARTASIHALRDVLLPPDEPAPLVPSAAPSPRPNAAAPQRFGQPVAPPPRTTGGRLGTPTRAGLMLARSNSVSRLYPAQFKHEADLGAAGRARAANGAAAAAQGSRDELEGARSVHGRFLKTGRELVLTTEQNSLLPLLLSFLNVGFEAAPHPMSLQGSAFQLAPLDGNSAPFPLPSFIAPGTAL